MREASMFLIVETIFYVMWASVQFQCNASGTGAVMSRRRRSCVELSAMLYVCRR